MKCQRRRKNGDPCGAQAVAGTEACVTHAGVPKDQHKAKGQVVVELSRWGISDKTLDPGLTLLQLMTQSFQRAKLYGALLEEAYEAAERLEKAVGPALHAGPPSADTAADRDRAMLDLERVFNTGGVSTLIGHTYAADKDGGVFATGEAIRGLVQLEAQERDRAAGMAAKAVAAGLATRQVELAEKQGMLVADTLRGALSDLAALMAAGQISTVDPSQPEVMRVVASRLRSIQGGAT